MLRRNSENTKTVEMSKAIDESDRNRKGAKRKHSPEAQAANDRVVAAIKDIWRKELGQTFYTLK